MSDSNPNDTFDLRRVSWVWDKDDLAHLLAAIRSAPVVVFDHETTGLDDHSVTGGPSNGGIAARLVLTSFTIPRYDDRGWPVGEPTTYLVPLSHPESPWRGRWRKVATHLAKAMRGQRLVAHHGKFDARYTYSTTGVDISHDLWWDTMVSSHMLDENRKSRLKIRASETFGIEPWDDFDLKTPGAAEMVSMFQLGEYAAQDTYWTWRLYENHRDRMMPEEEPVTSDEVEEARLGYLARWCSMPTTRTLAAIEQRGIGLDRAKVLENIRADEELRDETGAELVDLYPGIEGTPSFAPTSLWFRAWTEAAVRSGDLKIAAMTPNGRPQWSKHVLAKQARQGSWVAETLLEHRAAVKRLEFLRAWRDVAYDGRIFATYNDATVVTGRLSSSSPNMQQVSRGLKPMFVPSPGYHMVELDYSQIELRVAAFISGCEPMIAAYQAGADLHRLLAAQINRKPMAEVTKDERQRAKAGNFGFLYGMGAAGFQIYAEQNYGVELSIEQAVETRDAFFDTWDGLLEWHRRAAVHVDQTGQISSPLGRVRRLPMIWDNDDRQVAFAQRAAVNAPVQGMASDIMQIAASCIEGNIAGVDAVHGARLVGTVHDSILVEVPVDSWEETTRSCKVAMEAEVPRVLSRAGVDFTVPLLADVEVSTAWGLADISDTL